MQLVTEHHRSRSVLLAVLVLDGRAGEAEEDGVGEGSLDGRQHVTEHRAMTLIHDEDDALAVYDLDVVRGDAIVLAVYAAHLLDGGDNKGVGRVDARQPALEHLRVLGLLDVLRLLREAAVLLERLRAQFYAVHEEDHLVGILGVGDELGGLEAGHRLARPGGVPDIATVAAALAPPGLRHLVRYGVGGVVLIAAHDLEGTVGAVGDGVEANELVRHGDAEQA